MSATGDDESGPEPVHPPGPSTPVPFRGRPAGVGTVSDPDHRAPRPAPEAQDDGDDGR
jgi:hypothetical protein